MEQEKVVIDKYVAAAQSTEEKKYWLDKLSGELVKSNLYYDFKPKNADIRSFGKEEFRFSGELFSKFLQLSNNSDLRLHMILTAGLVMLIEKVTGQKDIIVGTPVYKEDDEDKFVNTVLALRNIVDTGQTFKEILIQVRQTILDAVEHVNYPVELLSEQLGMPVSNQDDFPLFDIVILLENIQDKKYIEHINYNIGFSLLRKEDALEGVVEYNAHRYHKETIEKIINHFIAIFQQVLFDVDVNVSQVDIISEVEKRQLLNDFNDTRVAFPKDKTIHKLFEEQAKRTPGEIAVCSPIDLNDMFTAASCFKKNPYVFEAGLGTFWILKTNSHNSAVVNKNMLKLIDCFTGEDNLESIFSIVKDFERAAFIIFTSPEKDLLGITHDFDRRAEKFSNMNYNEFISLVQLLHENTLIKFNSVKAHTPGTHEIKPGHFELNESFENRTVLKDLIKYNGAGLVKADVLLLGDTNGMPTTGLLYMASFLRRNGVKTLCRFYDDADNFQAMEADIVEMLDRIQPRVVGISMKWFLYIARVIDMCKIIKEYSRRHGLDIKVVVGGNTAAYYAEEMIAYDCIDYLVRGDGEEPILKIFRGEKNIPNCIYRENGEIIKNPITYVQDEKNASEIYLSHLDEILLSNAASLFGSFFVYTQKGCAMNCLYCGGCNKAQQKTFNRKHVLRRGVGEVRKDIIEITKYASALYFEFDILDKNLADYCRKIWEGIDLSGHFCFFNTLTPPSTELVELISRTFKYVYWDFDICTPSERHRKQLEFLKLVKPQPTDAEILDFMGKCEHFDNIEVRLNLITGLPHFTTEDIEPGEKLISEIMSTFSSFGELHWARLHAQPGAPILEYADQLEMHSSAVSFQDFLEYSKNMFNRDSGYVSVENFNYPYIYFKDDPLNSQITNHYLEINKKVLQYKENRLKDVMVCDTLTYRQLNEKAGRLAGVLRAKGVKPGGILGLMLERSLDIPVGILGILKADCAYMPIDPEFPRGRVEYMLTDSGAELLVRGGREDNELDTVSPSIERVDLNVDLNVDFNEAFETIIESPPKSTHPGDVSQLCYVIYTSGTTGKPKGTLLTHGNLVNYVFWFAAAAGITVSDRTILMSSFAFDLGYTSLYPSILNGGQLHILPREMYLLAERLLEYIKQKKITYLKLTPSLFSAIVNAPGFSPEKCRSLRLAAIGGEAIDVNDIKKAHALCPQLQIMNHYGPTEATIGCVSTFVDFDKFEAYKAHPVIGTPIYNTNVYILGKDKNVLPVGVPGELCITGSCVAEGYLNRPELTAEKFPPAEGYSFLTPYPSLTSAGTPGLSTPLYHTGDLAKWLPDGNIEFLGRIDTQVKVRGYRIELGEIENRLLEHSKVEEALVVVKENSEKTGLNEDGDKYLCAYYTRKENKDGPMGPGPGTEPVVKTGKIGDFINRFQEQVGKNPDKIAAKSDTRSLSYFSLERDARRLAHVIRENYDDRNKLSKNERTRYKRQMLLYDWGMESQEKLKGTTVFVAGAGGGASPTITQLALAGVGTIILCDFDEVELSNLNRQFLHDEERLGMNKALSAQMTINKLNPNVKVIPYSGKLTRDNVFEMVGNADIIFDMFDGPADKFVLSECAVAKGIPHVIISMTDINAYTTICHSPRTPCLHCLFDRKKLETIVSGMKNYVENYSKNPLPVVVTSLFISTGTAVNEALKILLGFKEPAYNKFFYFNQRGEEENLVYTPGYRAMTHLFSDHFLQLCKDQGFDWDTGWRGKYLEEFDIKPDPHCPLCGTEGGELRKSLEEKVKEFKVKEETAVNSEIQTVALLLNQNIDMAIAVTGTLESGKTYVPLDPASDINRLFEILEDSEARIILTGDDFLSLAEKLRDNVNGNIKVINIDRADEPGIQGEAPDIKIDPGQTAYILYPQGIGGTRDFNQSIEGLYRALFCGDGPYVFEENKQNAGKRTLPEELKDRLVEELPGYMVPSYFIRLDKMPLTPNGKVDRRALPDPDLNVQSEYIAPGNNIEKKLVEIWSEVLNVETDTIGINTNFFEAGGHSLNAVIMTAKLHKELNVNISLADVFKTSTINGLSQKIMGMTKETYVAIEPVEKKEYYPLASAQKRIFLSQQLQLKTTSYNISQLTHLGENIDRERLEGAFGKLIARHETLRTSFEVIEEETVQRISDHVDFAVEYHEEGDLTQGLKTGTVEEIMKHFVRPFDLSRAPLLRVALVKTTARHYMLLIDIHHIITDVSSVDILTGDFTALYAGVELEPIALQYKDFSQWQNSPHRKGQINRQEKYWLDLFSDAKELLPLDLPTDFERPLERDIEGDVVGFKLAGEEILFLREVAEDIGGTTFMSLLAVLNILLSKLSGREDIVVGMPIEGRRHADLEHVVGLFINTLPIRNFPSKDKTFYDFSLEIKQRVLDTMDNQDYQFEDLVNKIGLKRNVDRNPLIDVVFNLIDRTNWETGTSEENETGEAGENSENSENNTYGFKKQTSNFDIVFTAVDFGESLYLNFIYRSRLFKKETMVRFIDYFRGIITTLREGGHLTLGDVSISHDLAESRIDTNEEDYVGFDF